MFRMVSDIFCEEWLYRTARMLHHERTPEHAHNMISSTLSTAGREEAPSGVLP